MRHESTWLEYLRKLSNDGIDPAQSIKHRSQDVRTRVGTATSRHRSEWLQAGYAAQISLQPRSAR